MVAKVALIVKPNSANVDFYSTAGVVLVLCGAALIMVGWWQHRTVAARIREPEARAPATWPSSARDPSSRR